MLKSKATPTKLPQVIRETSEMGRNSCLINFTDRFIQNLPPLSSGTYSVSYQSFGRCFYLQWAPEDTCASRTACVSSSSRQLDKQIFNVQQRVPAVNEQRVSCLWATEQLLDITERKLLSWLNFPPWLVDLKPTVTHNTLLCAGQQEPPSTATAWPAVLEQLLWVVGFVAEPSWLFKMLVTLLIITTLYSNPHRRWVCCFTAVILHNLRNLPETHQPREPLSGETTWWDLSILFSVKRWLCGLLQLSSHEKVEALQMFFMAQIISDVQRVLGAMEPVWTYWRLREMSSISHHAADWNPELLQRFSSQLTAGSSGFLGLLLKGQILTNHLMSVWPAV